MFKLAVAWGMTPARPNPCRSVRRYKEHGRERFLSTEEYARLGRVLFDAEAEGPLMASAVAAIRLLFVDRLPQERDRDAAVGRLSTARPASCGFGIPRPAPAGCR